MKIALNAWSVPAQVPFAEMFNTLAGVGYDGVELNLDKEDSSAHALTFATTDAELAQIKKQSQAAGLAIGSVSSSLYGSGQLGVPDLAQRRRGQEILRRQLHLANALGADTILVVPSGISETVSRVEAYKYSLDTLAELKDEIEASGVKVGLENVWNTFFLSPVEMVSFIDQLDSKAIGAYFDVGNVAVFSYPEHWIEMLAERIFKIHIKDFRKGGSWFSGSFVNLYEGSINWQRVISALRSVGYADWLTAELGITEQYPAYLYEITHTAMRHMLQK